jgi:hypothetical protein
VLQLPASGPPPTFAADVSPAEPIHVARNIKGKKRLNVFLDNHGFPDQSHKLNIILHNAKGGPILRKRKHPDPPINNIDPRFLSHYEKGNHGNKMHSKVDLSHLDKTVRNQVYMFIQKYWLVFDDKGHFIPVKDYQCSVDTGSARPIRAKKINYGPCKSPIMCKCIALLKKLGHIHQIQVGERLFKERLAPKPH